MFYSIFCFILNIFFFSIVFINKYGIIENEMINICKDEDIYNYYENEMS